jgi:hypothetical protein
MKDVISAMVRVHLNADLAIGNILDNLMYKIIAVSVRTIYMNKI